MTLVGFSALLLEGAMQPLSASVSSPLNVAGEAMLPSYDDVGRELYTDPWQVLSIKGRGRAIKFYSRVY